MGTPILIRADHRPEWICRLECAIADFEADGNEARLRDTLSRLGFDPGEIEELIAESKE